VRNRTCGVRGCAGGTPLYHCTHAAPHSACTELPGAACGVVGPGCPAEGKAHRNTVLQGWHPKSTLELSKQQHCAHLAQLPGGPYAALSLPLLNRTGEKTQLTNSWAEAKSTLFFPCVVPTDSKLCVLMAAHQMQVSLHTLKQLLNSASISP